MTNKKTSVFRLAIVKERHFYEKVAAVMLPVALQQAINMGVNMMDTVMVGQLGEIQLSASSLANAFYTIYYVFCLGITGGCSVLSAQYWGAGETEKTKQTFSLGFYLTTFFAVVFMAITWFFPARIMRMYTPDPLVIAQGMRYLKVTVFIFFIHGTGFVTANLMRSVGQARLGLYVSVISFFVNIGANYVLIFGKFGFPRLEIVGAALGTLIARLAEMIVTFAFVFLKDKNLRLTPGQFLRFPSPEITKRYFKMGAPALVSDALLGFGMSAISMVLGRMGSAVVSANALCSVLERIFAVVVQGVSNAAGVVIGHTIGRRQLEEAQAQGETLYLIGLVLGVFNAILMMVLGPLTFRLYDLTPETIRIAREMICAYAVIELVYGAQNIITKGVLRGGGDTRFLMVADILFQWILSIPLGVLVGVILHAPGWMTILCLRIDYFIKAIWCLFRLKSGVWIKEVNVRARPAPAGDDTADN